MPPSVHERRTDHNPPGQGLAAVAEALYLINLLLLPGVAFVVLLVIYFRRIGNAPPLARCHLRQTVAASVWAGVFLIGLNIAIIAFGGFSATYTWVAVILYFTVVHASLVLLGALGLAKALAGQAFRYPVVGRPCDA